MGRVHPSLDRLQEQRGRAGLVHQEARPSVLLADLFELHAEVFTVERARSGRHRHAFVVVG